MGCVAISYGLNLIQNIEECISKLGGISQFIPENSIVFIKPDLTLPLGPPVTVQPQALGHIVKLCRDMGAKEIYIGFNPFDGISSKQVLKLLGLNFYLEKLGASILTLEDEPYSSIQIENHIFFKELFVPEKLIRSDVFISIVAPRTDVFGEFALGLKNYFDLLLDTQKQELFKSGSLNGLLDFYKKYPPQLTIWDAMTIGEGQGPFNQKAVPYNLILASADLLAGDSILIKLMGYDPLQVEFMRSANTNQIETNNLEDITIVGENVANHCKNLKKATSSSRNISSSLDLIEERPCLSCQICLRYTLDFLYRFLEKDFKEFGGISIFLGKFLNKLTYTIKNIGILFGDCAISSNLQIQFANPKKKTLFKFPGCPPLNLRSLEKFCLDFKENLPFLEFIEEFIRRWTLGRVYKQSMRNRSSNMENL